MKVSLLQMIHLMILRLKTSVEEREYNTIPGSVTATRIALSHSRAQANLTIEHGPLHWKVKG